MSFSPASPRHKAPKLSTRAGGSSTDVRGGAPLIGQSGAGMVGMFIGRTGLCTLERVIAERPRVLVTVCESCGLSLIRHKNDPEVHAACAEFELALPPALVAGAQRPEPGRASGTSAGREAHPDGNHGDNNNCPGRQS